MIYISGRCENVIFRNKNGKCHRDDGPAVINGNYQAWYQNDKLHRIDGPAFISGNHRHINGKYQEWYIDGVYYTEHNYHNRLKEMDLV